MRIAKIISVDVFKYKQVVRLHLVSLQFRIRENTSQVPPFSRRELFRDELSRLSSLCSRMKFDSSPNQLSLSESNKSRPIRPWKDVQIRVPKGAGSRQQEELIFRSPI